MGAAVVDTAYSIMYRTRSAASTNPGGLLGEWVPTQQHVISVCSSAVLSARATDVFDKPNFFCGAAFVTVPPGPPPFSSMNSTAGVF